VHHQKTVPQCLDMPYNFILYQGKRLCLVCLQTKETQFEMIYHLMDVHLDNRSGMHLVGLSYAAARAQFLQLTQDGHEVIIKQKQSKAQ
jgi:hypothetical protein